MCSKRRSCGRKKVIISMKKKKVSKISSKAIMLHFENIDTDQILPAKYLRGIGKENYDQVLFYHWRYSQDGSFKENIFDKKENKKRQILITGKNFGCGSSREHAVWALKDFGFKAIIASSFGDIFKNNALNNHILPITVSETFVHELFSRMEKNPDMVFDIDIERQELQIQSKNLHHHFEISAYKKHCLIYHYDDLSYLLSMKKKIEVFETKRKNDFSIVR